MPSSRPGAAALCCFGLGMFELTGAPTRVSGQQAPAGELPRCCACLIERFRGTLKHGPTKVQAFSPGTVSDTKWIEHVEAPVTFTKSEGVFCSLFVSLVCLFVCFAYRVGFSFGTSPGSFLYGFLCITLASSCPLFGLTGFPSLCRPGKL